jgi:hypothetical protein
MPLFQCAILYFIISVVVKYLCSPFPITNNGDQHLYKLLFILSISPESRWKDTNNYKVIDMYIIIPLERKYVILYILFFIKS